MKITSKILIITYLAIGLTACNKGGGGGGGNENHGGGSEHSLNNAKHSDSLKHFKTLAGVLLNYDEILVFGPGKSQEQFQNYLHEDVRFKSKQITIDSAEQLTDPQMIAKVRDYFR